MTSDAKHIELDHIPSMGSMLLKTLMLRKPAQAEPQFKPISVSVKGVKTQADKLAKYCDVCGFTQTNTLPATYPNIMGFALVLQLMLEPEFPFGPVGAVHICNHISQTRALGANEALDFTVRMGDSAQVNKGYETNFITEIRVADELVWQASSVMLIRKGGSGESKKSNTAEPAEYQQTVDWHLAANKGRQYAAASGDYNPIHLYPFTAKLMGFKRQIMHGMWSKSRALAHLVPADYNGPITAEVAFKLPIFLPSNLTFMVNSTEAGSEFELRDEAGKKPHMAGSLSYN